MQKIPELINQFSAAGVLWVRVVEQAMSDLCLRGTLVRGKLVLDTRAVINAARYFFLEPQPVDFINIKTFTGLCTATGINHEVAAQAIWRKLEPHHKRRVLMLLRDDGLNVNLGLVTTPVN